jgi:hypothetical protein
MRCSGARSTRYNRSFNSLSDFRSYDAGLLITPGTTIAKELTMRGQRNTGSGPMGHSGRALQFEAGRFALACLIFFP